MARNMSDDTASPSGEIFPERSARIGFSRNRLVRHSERREKASDIAAMMALPEARSFVIAGDVPILRRDGEAFTPRFTMAEAGALAPVAETALLGTLDGTPLFATLIAAGEAERLKESGLFAIDLRSIAVQGLLPQDELGPLGEGKALMDWHRRHGFCANCGVRTASASGGDDVGCGEARRRPAGAGERDRLLVPDGEIGEIGPDDRDLLEHRLAGAGAARAGDRAAQRAGKGHRRDVVARNPKAGAGMAGGHERMGEAAHQASADAAELQPPGDIGRRDLGRGAEAAVGRGTRRGEAHDLARPLGDERGAAVAVAVEPDEADAALADRHGLGREHIVGEDAAIGLPPNVDDETTDGLDVGRCGTSDDDRHDAAP